MGHEAIWNSSMLSGNRLVPAYDLNPVPTDIKPRVLSTLISSDDGTASSSSQWKFRDISN